MPLAKDRKRLSWGNVNMVRIALTIYSSLGRVLDVGFTGILVPSTMQVDEESVPALPDVELQAARKIGPHLSNLEIYKRHGCFQSSHSP